MNLIEELLFELKGLGYSQKITFKVNRLYYISKNLVFKPNDLFFVDAGFILENSQFLFAINSPLFDVKGFLQLSKYKFESLLKNGYENNFDLMMEHYSSDSPAISIKRQYNMRKVSKIDFDPKRYILRKGFPDFPACPYGYAFKALGYDKIEKEYVRLSLSILKNDKIVTEEYDK